MRSLLTEVQRDKIKIIKIKFIKSTQVDILIN